MPARSRRRAGPRFRCRRRSSTRSRTARSSRRRWLPSSTSRPPPSACPATSGQQGQFNFGAWRLSIAEALGKTNGLNDNLADPASVYLYRGERREVAEQLGVDCARFSGPVVPVIYNLNLRDPAGYFLATKFEMHNKDVVFASNSVSVESSKMLTYLRLITATVNDPLMAAVNAYTVKVLATGTAGATVVNTTSSVKSSYD